MGLSFNALDHLKEEKMFHYVAKIVTTGTEWYEDSNQVLDAKLLAHTAIQKAKITTSRFNPKPYAVEVCKLIIKLGNVEKSLIGTVDVTPPFAPMTDMEYKSEMAKILLDVPASFRGFVEQDAWDRGHSSGYEEVINIASSLVADLKPAIKAFEKELIALVGAP
jgi:hypothetical protein